jgi:hypothetical protein
VVTQLAASAFKMGRTAVLSLNAASLASPRLSPDMHDSGVHKRGKSSPTTSRVRRDAERAKKLGTVQADRRV